MANNKKKNPPGTTLAGLGFGLAVIGVGLAVGYTNTYLYDGLTPVFWGAAAFGVVLLLAGILQRLFSAD